MENQHRKITGYRDLSQEEIDLMNEIKTKAAEVGELVSRVQAHATLFGGHEGTVWGGVAKIDLQKGFMALTRAVALPDSF